MTTETLALADFLIARIAHDERVAQAVVDDLGEWSLHLADNALDSEWPFADHFDPARVLAEVKAKREIVAGLTGPVPKIHKGVRGRLEGDAIDWAWTVAREGTLAFLALPYADHPDYRDEWRP